MKLTIEGNETEIKNVLQAINGSKEHDEFHKRLDTIDRKMIELQMATKN